MTAEAIAPECVRDCLALLRGYLEGDDDAIRAVLDAASGESMASCMAGILFGVLAFGARVDPLEWVLGEQDYIRGLIATQEDPGGAGEPPA